MICSECGGTRMVLEVVTHHYQAADGTWEGEGAYAEFVCYACNGSGIEQEESEDAVTAKP